MDLMYVATIIADPFTSFVVYALFGAAVIYGLYKLIVVVVCSMVAFLRALIAATVWLFIGVSVTMGMLELVRFALIGW